MKRGGIDWNIGNRDDPRASDPKIVIPRGEMMRPSASATNGPLVIPEGELDRRMVHRIMESRGMI